MLKIKLILISLFIFCGLSYSQNMDSYKDTIIVPDAFTPEKTSNTIFKPYVLGYDDYKIYIYNRWGNLIFEGKYWDGRHGGYFCVSGVYIWKIVAYNSNGETIKYGQIILIR